MSDALRPPERRAWMAVVIVLASALAWLAVVDVALALPALSAHAPAVLTVGRVLLRAAVGIGQRIVVPGLVVVLVPAFALGLVLAWRRPAGPDREVDHA